MNRCIFIIAGNTVKEITRQTLFYLITCGGVLLIFLSFSFTLFAFGEETRMIKEMGVSTITICCLYLASLSAANTMSKEIEKGTIMTLLSKPVDKSAIPLGKFLGILVTVLLVFMIMGLSLILSLCIKESFDYHTGLLAIFERVVYPTALQLIFAFLQIAIMCAIATAGSVYMSMISNLCCCMAIYITGNLINFFQGILQMNGGGAQWYFMLLFILFPNLEVFSTPGVENKFGSLDLIHMGLLAIYAILYIMFVIVLT
ncbi:MAG: ABC transporter permease subunit, partial [Candidatus Brocadia sp.]